MREYKTQMEAARKGIVTEELKKVAQKEHLRVEELMPLVAAGKVAICANKNHKCLDPQGVGSMLLEPKSMSILEYPETGKIMILKCRKLWQRWIWERTQSWICLPMEILQDSGEN